jgi:hypothetical protein
MELRAQHSDQRLDCFGREFNFGAQRLLGAQHEKPLAVNGYCPLEEYAVDAQRIGERFPQPRSRR